MSTELKSAVELSLAAVEIDVSAAEAHDKVALSNRSRELHEQGVFADRSSAMRYLEARAAVARGERIAPELAEFFEDAEKLVTSWEKVRQRESAAFAAESYRKALIARHVSAEKAVRYEEEKVRLLRQWIEKQREIYVDQIAGNMNEGIGGSSPMATGFGGGIADAESQIELIEEFALPKLQRELDEAIAEREASTVERVAGG